MSQTLDLAIVGGIVVRPGHSPAPANIGIAGEKIVALTAPSVELQARETVNAGGAHIFPGVIEPHAHWGVGNGIEDVDTESVSSALGGVTTVLFFLRKNESYDPLFREWVTRGEDRSLVDFGLHAVVMTEAHLREIDHYVQDLGITSFKCYFTYRGEDAAWMGIENLDDGFLFEAFQRVAAHPRALVMAHCENIELVHRARRRLRAAGLDDMVAWQASRPVLAEVDAVRRAMLFAQAAGCRLNILHLASEAALSEIQTFRQRYSDIHVEVCHPYLALYDDGSLSRAAKFKPPLRTMADREALWQGVADGSVTSVGSDHVPRRLEVKNGSIWNRFTGAPGTAMLLPILLSEGYHRRGIPLSRIAELVCSGPAQLYGLYPRKGDLSPGSDADLVLVDLKLERTVEAARLGSYADYSPYEGRRVKGWPTHTMVRGHWVMVDGQIVGEPGTGRYLKR